MSTVALAHGWQAGMVRFGGPGKALFIGGTYWATNGRAGFAGFNGTNATDMSFNADSTDLLDNCIRWLCGKASGANLLLVTTIAGGASINFDTRFRDALDALGHTYDITDAVNNFNGYEPLDYDLTCIAATISSGTYHGLTTHADKITYILNNKGKLLIDYNQTNTYSAWGVDASSLHSAHTPAQRPVTGSVIKPAGTVKAVMASSLQLHTGTNTKGGTSAVEFCDTHGTQGVIGWWQGA